MTGTRLDVKQNKKKVMEKRKEVGVSTDKKKKNPATSLFDVPPYFRDFVILVFFMGEQAKKSEQR